MLKLTFMLAAAAAVASANEQHDHRRSHNKGGAEHGDDGKEGGKRSHKDKGGELLSYKEVAEHGYGTEDGKRSHKGGEGEEHGDGKEGGHGGGGGDSGHYAHRESACAAHPRAIFRAPTRERPRAFRCCAPGLSLRARLACARAPPARPSPQAAPLRRRGRPPRRGRQQVGRPPRAP